MTSLCVLSVLTLSIVFLVWGFIDLLRKRKPSEVSEGQVISRQLKGLGMIVLAQVIVVVGAAFCYGTEFSPASYKFL